jgi:CRP/FNR family transcriptional regulator, cyclic AMP receptor protein
VARAKKRPFDVSDFLSKMDGGRTLQTFRKNQNVFAQGDQADAVFYIQEGKVKVCVMSERGKEAVVALHGAGDFFGDGCLTGQPLRLATVSAMTDCVIMRLDKAAMVSTLRDEPKLSECSWHTSWLGRLASRRIWSISFSIRAKSVWRGSFC